MLIPKDVLEIINKIENAGYEAFIVGGCVRDFLLSDTPKDWDITTNALPEDIKKLFDHTVETGIQHGTITVVLNKNNYEVTTYRIDGEYTDFRRPTEVLFTKDIVDDLSRRDFTMNAIAYNPKNLFIDHFGGQEDIKNKIIKGVGIAEVRFNEDALRMMRAIRFANQLNFTIEEETFNAIKRNAHLIKKISIERVRDEFIKLLKSVYIENISLLETSGLLQYFLPEIKVKLEKDIKKNIIILKNLKENYILRLAFLLNHLEEDKVVDILKRLKLDNASINEIKLIIRHFYFEANDNIIETRKIMSVLDYNIFKNLIFIRFVIARANKNLKECKTLDNIYDQVEFIIKTNQCFSLKNLEINGNDLKNLGISNGKIIGKILNHCLDLVLINQEKNKKEILLNEAKNFIKD